LRNGLIGSVAVIASAGALTLSASLEQSAIQAEANTARSMLSAHAARTAEQRALETSQAQSRNRLALVGILSQHLPDGVWLDQLTIEQSDLTLVGFGPATADVQRILAGLPFLTDVHLAAPVTRDNNQSLERFRIAARLTGPVSLTGETRDE
jgi:Tfp pilus assembly protein PilN